MSYQVDDEKRSFEKIYLINQKLLQRKYPKFSTILIYFLGVAKREGI